MLTLLQDRNSFTMPTASPTDLAIIKGARLHGNSLHPEGELLIGKINDEGRVLILKEDGISYTSGSVQKTDFCTIHLVLSIDDKEEVKDLKEYYKVQKEKGFAHPTYFKGMYPQNAAPFELFDVLFKHYENGPFPKTGSYSLPNPVRGEIEKVPCYSFEGKNYVLVRPECYSSIRAYPLSNGINCKTFDKDIWIEVSPIEWYIDETGKFLISKKGLLSGLNVNPRENLPTGSGFKESRLYDFLNKRVLIQMMQGEKSIFESQRIIEQQLTYLKERLGILRLQHPESTDYIDRLFPPLKIIEEEVAYQKVKKC